MFTDLERRAGDWLWRGFGGRITASQMRQSASFWYGMMERLWAKPAMTFGVRFVQRYGAEWDTYGALIST